MNRSYGKALISFSIVSLLLLSSCAWVKSSQVKSSIKEARGKLMSGDFQQALDMYQSAYEKYQKDDEMLQNYIKAIESVRAHGDESFDRDDFVQAQITYDLLLKNFSRFGDFSNLLSFKRDFLITRLITSRVLAAEKQAQSSLKRGEVQKAIDAYRDLHQQYPSDTMVRRHYIRILESIKNRADLEFKSKDFALAAWTYRILQKNYFSFNHLGRSLSYNSGLLDTKIENCRKILFENGLEQYRSGNLGQAISVWKSILTFDPENPEIKKAVETASHQAKRLEGNTSDDAK